LSIGPRHIGLLLVAHVTKSRATEVGEVPSGSDARSAPFVGYLPFTQSLMFEYLEVLVPGCDRNARIPAHATEVPVTATAPQSRQNGQEQLLTPGEVAALFRVDPKTVTRWATAGRIGSIRTPGGHRRFRESEVRTLLAELTNDVHPS
jgi:excisionase family DNA binding protein